MSTIRSRSAPFLTAIRKAGRTLAFGCLLMALAVGTGAFAVEAPAVPASIRVTLDDNFPPFSFRDDAGELQGLLKDTWTLWSARTGVKVEFRAMDWAKAQETMQSGGADVIDTISRSPARDRLYDFTEPYAQMQVRLFFHETISGIVDAASSRGFAVGVKDGDICIARLHELGGPEAAALRRYPSYSALVEAAGRSEVRVFCMNEQPAHYFLARQGLSESFRESPPLYASRFHRAVRKGDAATLRLVVDGFAKITDAEMAQVHARWEGASMGRRAISTALRYAGYGAVVLGALALLLMWLNRTLRQRVAERTASLGAAREDVRVAERGLRASEARYRNLFESSADALMLLGPDGFIDCNPATLVLFGCPDVDAFCRQSPESLSPPVQPSGEASVKVVARHKEAALRDGSATFVWTHHRLDNGREFVAEVMLSPVSPDQPDLLQARVRDVTQRIRMETELQAHRARLEELVAARTAELDSALARLREGEQRLAWAMEATRDGLWDWNIRSGETYYNPAYLGMLGYAPGELAVNAVDLWVALLHPDDRAATLAEATRRLETDGGYELEFRLRCKDGGYKWIMSRGKVVARDADGRPVRAVGTHTDLTVRKRAEIEVRTVNEELGAIFEAAPEGIVLMRDRHIIRCNRRLEEIFGYGHREFDGQPTRLWYPDDASYERIGTALGRSIAEGRTHRDEVRMVRRDGTAFWARLTGRAIDPADLTKGLLGIIEDVTLEHDRQAQLQQAKEQAEAATRAKSDFLANMSHEIRTPMNAIIGMSHLVMKTELNARQREYLGKIQGASHHLLGIINDILDFSKIESGKLVIERAEFDLDQMLGHVATLLGEKAAAKGLEFVLDVDSAIPRNLVGDALRLEQVLLNLGSNALKFTPQGEVVITARVQERSESGLLLRFAVRDTGIGLSGEQRDRLFQSFQQADTSTTRKYGGTGLGLVIAKRLAEQMGGGIGVDSEPGRGSTFWFTVEVGVGLVPGRSLLPDPDLRGRRVLVVDDNDNARTVLREMLASMTFVVDEADSGERAIEAIRRSEAQSRPFEVVYLDWRMPGLDGIETARRIRAMALARPPKLVMVTAYGREEVRAEADAAGFEAVLTKPVTPSLLFDAAMQLLGQRGSEPRAPRARPSQEAELLSDIRGARVLVVEDNALNQEVARDLLTGAGFVVEVADDGQVALAKVQAWPCDLVFMDMQMPVMDGIAATVAIRRLEGFAELPIVAMTANAMPKDRERCLQAGMNDYIAKPIDPDELWAVMRRWIRPRVQPSTGVADAPREALAAPAPGTVAAGAVRDIAGLDVDAGLRRVLGRESRYLELLRKFVAGQRTAADDIRQALAAGDAVGAQRLAHTLKGLAGTIGAAALQSQAEALEAAIGEEPRDTRLESRIDGFRQALTGLVSALDARLPVGQPAVSSTDLDAGQLAAVCRRLDELMASDDAEALDVLETNSGLLAAAFPAKFGTIAEAIRRFDFDNARQALGDALAGAQR